MATDRQLKLLSYIIDEYVKTGVPVSSSSLIKTYDLTISPATVRNEMVALENEGLIEKPHTSGGRIPTSKGYECHIQSNESGTKTVSKIKKEIKQIFDDRNKTIDEVLDKALSFVKEATNSITVSKKKLEDALLQDIKVYKISEEKAMILAVFSNGVVNNMEFELKGLNFKDIEISIHIFADRLQGIHASNLEDTAMGLKSVLSEQVQDLEDQYQEFIDKIFKGLLAYEHDYSLSDKMLPSTEIDSETVFKLMQSLKDQSIWEMLSKTKNVEKNSTKVTVNLESEGLNKISAVTKTITAAGINRDIALLGSTDSNYKEIIEVLEVIEDEIKKFGG